MLGHQIGQRAAGGLYRGWRAIKRMGDLAQNPRRALSAAPEDAQALNGLGVAQSLLGQTQQARASFTQALSLNPGYYFAQGWMHAKLTLVVALVIYQHLCGAQLKRFARGENTRSHVFYRWFNEAPVLALLGIVVLVVVRPF